MRESQPQTGSSQGDACSARSREIPRTRAQGARNDPRGTSFKTLNKWETRPSSLGASSLLLMHPRPREPVPKPPRWLAILTEGGSGVYGNRTAQPGRWQTHQGTSRRTRRVLEQPLGRVPQGDPRSPPGQSGARLENERGHPAASPEPPALPRAAGTRQTHPCPLLGNRRSSVPWHPRKVLQPPQYRLILSL